jgi:hypothetical protein
MAKQQFDTSFYFGANAKPKKGGKGKKPKTGGKSNAWAAYAAGGKRR